MSERELHLLEVLKLSLGAIGLAKLGMKPNGKHINARAHEMMNTAVNPDGTPMFPRAAAILIGLSANFRIIPTYEQCCDAISEIKETYKYLNREANLHALEQTMRMHPQMSQ